jgi:hypothetical protein
MEEEKKSSLPAMQERMNKDVIEKSLKREEEVAFFARIQKFVSIVNTDVEEDKLQQHPVAKKARYLPISFMEMALDELFYGLWCTEDFRWAVVANEVVATMTLKVWHPVLKQWIVRTGVAAGQIMVDAIPESQKSGMTKRDINAWAVDLGNKKPAALEMGGFASLKADCFKNACLSLGRYFGRDVNREHHAEDYLPTLKDPDERKSELRQRISDGLETFQEGDEHDKIVQEILTAEESGTNTVAFYLSILKKVVVDVSDN